MEKTIKRILVTGEGGQGVQLVCHALTKAAFYDGLHVAYMPNYGVEQRGGVSIGYLQVGTAPIGFPKFAKADVMVVLRKRAIERTAEYVDDGTLYIYDDGLIEGKDLKDIAAEKLAIPATQMAGEKLEPKVFNMIIAGALLAEAKIVTRKNFEKALEELLADKYKKKPQLRNLNKKALDLGERLAREAYSIK